MATLSWRRPAHLNGHLLGYRLTYGSLAADFVVTDQRLLDADKRRFTTGFLGLYIPRHGGLAVKRSRIRSARSLPRAGYKTKSSRNETEFL